jgi:hypothetical protein
MFMGNKNGGYLIYRHVKFGKRIFDCARACSRVY